MLKKSKRFLTIALILLLCLASVSSAFANTLNEEGATVGTETNPVTATITKNLRMPAGTNTPDAIFNFQVTKVSVDGVPGTDANMPNLNPLALSVSFTETVADTATPPPSTVTISRTTADLFYGVTFPHAGVFVYEIREQRPSNPTIDNDPNLSLTYSEAVYTLTVYVANNVTGDGTFVMATGIVVTVADSTVQTPVNGKVGQIIFTNDFVRTNGPIDPERPDPVNRSTLFVSKQVAGDFASRELYFEFSMTLVVPALVENPPAFFSAYVVENGAVVNDLAENVNVTPAPQTGTDAGGSYIQISTSGPTSFRLKDGQRLVFVDTPVGTGYVANEAAAINYTPSFIVTTNNVPGQNVTGTLSQPLSTGDQLVGELLNSAAFTNTRDFVTPTGLNLTNLPFYGLILLALGALITFIIVKVKGSNRRYYY